MKFRQEEGIIVFECPSCEFIDTAQDLRELDFKEKLPKKEWVEQKANEHKNDFATYPNKCKKCGYDFAQVLDLGIFVSDEDNLILLKCGKCGFSERVGKRTS